MQVIRVSLLMLRWMKYLAFLVERWKDLHRCKKQHDAALVHPEF